MNAHPNPSEMFARAKALKRKFYSPKPALTHPQRTPEHQREHVQAYRAWQAWTGQPMTAKQYFEALCWLAGHAPEVIRSHDEKREKYAVRKSIIRSLVHQYPLHSKQYIGSIVNRDHTSVFYAAGLLRQRTPVQKPDKYAVKTTKEDRKLMRNLRHKGMSIHDIAVYTCFSAATVTKAVRNPKW